jgi:hypothetical protein
MAPRAAISVRIFLESALPSSNWAGIDKVLIGLTVD